MRAVVRPVFTAVKGRFYSAQAAEQSSQKLKLANQDARITRLANGAVVASVENNHPVSRLAVLYNAGSRYEDAHHIGITHVLRTSINCSNNKTSSFGMTRGIQQMGGSLTATTNRENVMFSLDFMRDDFDSALQFIADASMHPLFKTWEVDALKEHILLDLASLHAEPNIMVMEGLHKAAFRNTLGNSLYMPKHKVGSYSPATLEEFTSKHYVASNMAIVGTDVGDHDEFVWQIQHKLGFAKDAPKPAPEKVKATYHIGEQRVDNSSSLVHAALVTEGASLGSKDLIPLALLQRIMGTGPCIKYSNNLASSKIGQAAAGVTSGPYAASAININYSDSGLFGFYIVGQAADMGKLLTACVAAYGNATKGAIAEAELARAKTGLKSSIQMSLEDKSTVLADLGTQALLTGQLVNTTEMLAAIDKVTAADVQNVAKKVINGKPSMSVVGDLSSTPYLDELL